MKNWFELDITESRLALYKELLDQNTISPLEVSFMCNVEVKGKVFTFVRKRGL